MVLAATAAFATLAPVATAAEVHFDPDSPAGKEYALPLDQARDEAAGGKAADRPPGVPAPLFGEGVEARDGAPGSADESGGSGDGGEPGGGTPGNANSPGGGGRNAAAVGLADVETNNDYPLSSGLLLIAAVLLVGAGIGLALRLAGRTSSRPA